ncbi:hypothetical protein AWB74_07886 [Caballeronia arvi]|uniref:Uncharacterized protein n=1 Tax=Caballeronia arvi TaxID=1777135 RepID=A0A158L0H0_9BURK|nr:hypothetical protein [Caballeronia arvi]SAL86888.1 hypothetical protein AWB74_07886 [Caballeronia arvi]
MKESFKSVILRIYQTPNGQWAGRLMIGNEDVGWIAGCASPAEVEQAIRETGMCLDQVEVRLP